MDDLLNKPAPQPQPLPASAPGVVEQLDSLRHLIISVMVLVLVFAGTFDLYLLRQVKYASAELTAIRPQAEQLLAGFQKYTAPAFDNFARQIVQYGQTHQDFGPILEKYRLKPVTNQSSIMPAPGVTSPAAPKK